MEQFFIENGGVIIRLAVALGLGAIIGAERLYVHKEAGMKTHALVAMGSALFVIISEVMAQKYAGLVDYDASRMASQIVVGIGFLGAGAIMHYGPRLSGLTTAGGLWVTAGIGMAAGFGLLSLSVISTVLVLLILVVLYFFERPIRKISEMNHNGDDEWKN